MNRYNFKTTKLLRMPSKTSIKRSQESRKKLLNYARAKYKIAPMIRYNQSHIGGEIKSVDVYNPSQNSNTQANFPLNTTPQITTLNAITIGSSSWNRVGRKVSLKSVHVKGYFALAGNTSTAIQNVRLVVVYDKQTNGSLPSWDDVFRDQVNSSSDSNSSAVFNLNAGINLNNRDRFEIIMDKRMILPVWGDNGGVTTMTEELCHINEFHKLGGREVHFKADSTPGVIGDVSTGGLYVLTAGNLASGSEAWAANLNIRIRYTDL